MKNYECGYKKPLKLEIIEVYDKDKLKLIENIIESLYKELIYNYVTKRFCNIWLYNFNEINEQQQISMTLYHKDMITSSKLISSMNTDYVIIVDYNIDKEIVSFQCPDELIYLINKLNHDIKY